MATYYIDADHGDNGNAGTSAAAAWETWAYAVTQTMNSWDTVYLRRCENNHVTVLNDFLTHTGNQPPYGFMDIIGDNGNYGITEWASDTTTCRLGNSGGSYAMRLSSAVGEKNIRFKNIQFFTGGVYFRDQHGGDLVFENCFFGGVDHPNLADKVTDQILYREYQGSPRTIFRDCTMNFFDSAGLIRGVYSGGDVIFQNCVIDHVVKVGAWNYCSPSILFEDSTIGWGQYGFTDWNGDPGYCGRSVIVRRCHLHNWYEDEDFRSDMKTNDTLMRLLHRDDNEYVDIADNPRFYNDVEEPFGVLEDINGVPGPFARFGPDWIVMYDSTTPALLRSGGGTSVLTYRGIRFQYSASYPNTCEDSTTRICIAKFDFDLPDADGATQYNASVWAQADSGWGTSEALGGSGVGGDFSHPTLYLSVEYLSGPDGEEIITRSFADSTEHITADDTWTELKAGFIPTKAGPARAKVWISHWNQQYDHLYLDNFFDVVEAT